MNQIATVGADLAKAVIVMCAADREGRVQFYKQFSFDAFAQWAATMLPCTSVRVNVVAAWFMRPKPILSARPAPH
jgi:hypothetical protein